MVGDAAVSGEVALDAADLALMRDDWALVRHAFSPTRRTMRPVSLNFCFTANYDLVGRSTAALGILPPILAATTQSLPDLDILSNSLGLLRQR